jgi:hypothetical protein
MRKHLRRIGNVLVIGLLRSPLHPLASGSLLLITYRGRNSGRRFTIPVMYAERAGTLTIFVGHSERKRWWRNFRGGGEVEVRLRGRCLRAQADVVRDSAAVERISPATRGLARRSTQPTRPPSSASPR